MSCRCYILFLIPELAPGLSLLGLFLLPSRLRYALRPLSRPLLSFSKNFMSLDSLLSKQLGMGLQCALMMAGRIIDSRLVKYDIEAAIPNTLPHDQAHNLRCNASLYHLL